MKGNASMTMVREKEETRVHLQEAEVDNQQSAVDHHMKNPPPPPQSKSRSSVGVGAMSPHLHGAMVMAMVEKVAWRVSTKKERQDSIDSLKEVPSQLVLLPLLEGEGLTWMRVVLCTCCCCHRSGL
jgi:hypothetical protein